MEMPTFSEFPFPYNNLIGRKFESNLDAMKYISSVAVLAKAFGWLGMLSAFPPGAQGEEVWDWAVTSAWLAGGFIRKFVWGLPAQAVVYLSKCFAAGLKGEQKPDPRGPPPDW